MIKSKNRKKPRREYKKDTFKAYQENNVSEREQSIHEVLAFSAGYGHKFKNITKLAEHVSEILKKEKVLIDPATLIRKRYAKDGTEAPNSYRIMLLQYQAGKYLPKGKAPRITAEDIADIRTKYPAVDAYCAQKEGDCKNYQEQVKLLTRENDSLKEGRALQPQKTNADSNLSRELDHTVTALMRLITELSDFVMVDWQQRAIVDTAYDSPKVLVGPELLSSFFMALEKSGMKPREVR
jgi:hypothetical protein